jgi:YbgC/YbaW family acyl-CoA thioester hydrolase
MIQTMKTDTRVSFEDCDPFAHLNNANYLNYFLTAREKQLRTNNILDIFKHAEKTGKSWAVMSHDIRYLRPAKLGEELEIWSRMLTHDSFINLIEFAMVSKTSRQLKSIMHTQLAYFSVKRARPVAHDDDLKHLFDSISLFPDKTIKEFNIQDRVKTIRKEILITE